MIFKHWQERRQRKFEFMLNFFKDNFEEVRDNSKIKDTADFIQHGSTSRYLHSVAVSYYSYRLARLLKMDNSLGELIRASLVHDYFFYNSKTDDPLNKGHMINHPKYAFKKASKVFNLTDREKDIIENHMFPLSTTVPKYKESYVVCFVDKMCAVYEFFRRRNPYPHVNHHFAKDRASGKLVDMIKIPTLEV